MGYKFRIEYKSGVLNRVADALSRHDDDRSLGGEDLLLFMAVSQPLPDILELLREDVNKLDEMRELWTQIQNGTAPSGFVLCDKMGAKN